MRLAMWNLMQAVFWSLNILGCMGGISYLFAHPETDCLLGVGVLFVMSGWVYGSVVLVEDSVQKAWILLNRDEEQD